MRILFLDQFSQLGGAQQNLLALFEEVRRRRWQATLGLPGDGELARRSRALGVATFPIRCGPFGLGDKSAADLGRFLWQLPGLAREIGTRAAEFEPDLIYVNGPRLLPATALAGVTAPVLFHSHSYVRSALLRRLSGWALRRLRARVIACCRYVAEPWESFAESVRVVYNGAAVRGRPAAHFCKPAPRIGCIGRISPEKGQLEFLAAARRIHNALPEARFSIHGEPLFSKTAAHYAALVRSRAHGIPVEFAGWSDDIASVLAGLDLLLVPSAPGEATTRVIPEAFAAGVPVIAFAAGGIPEMVQHGRTGFLCRTAAEMAEFAIELLSREPSRYQAVAQAAREAWRIRFTLERWQQQVAAEMERCAAGVQCAASAATVSA